MRPARNLQIEGRPARHRRAVDEQDGALRRSRRGLLPQEELDVALAGPVFLAFHCCHRPMRSRVCLRRTVRATGRPVPLPAHRAPCTGYTAAFLCKNPRRQRRRTLDTFPKLLLRHAQERAARPAIREKDLGIWQTWTWRTFADEVCALAAGLAERGFRRGEHIALIGDNRPRIYAGICAAQCLGGIPVPLYQDAVAAEMAFPIQNAEIAHALVEDQEQVDKLLEILPQCPSLRHIYYDDPRGLRHYYQPQLMSYEKLLEAGRAALARNARLVEEEIAQGKGSDTAAMFFTSGTTGVPKGVVLTNDALIDRARAVAEMEKLGDS